MGRKKVQTRADPDTVEALTDYADDHELSQSEAVRRMIRAGLSANDYEIAAADGMGTGQLDELANQLTEIEQRQAARANQRERLEKAQAVSVFAGLSYLIFTQILGASGPLWTVVGVMAVASFGASYLWAAKLGGGADE